MTAHDPGDGADGGAPPDHTRDFRDVAAAEREEIARQRGVRGAGDGPVVGLALSGGGIRSATFGLGVLQALNDRGYFPRLDYLSTVSGGGFIGTALGWFQRQTRGRFPFVGRRAPGGEGPDGDQVLDFLRLHANYLDQRVPPPEEPSGPPARPGERAGGESFSLFALLSVVGQQMLLTLFVYGGLVVVGFFFLHSLDALLRPLKVILALNLGEPTSAPWLQQTNFMMVVGLALLAAYAVLAPYYSLRMFLAPRMGRGRHDPALAGRRQYALRLRMERRATGVLRGALAALLIGSVPLVANGVGQWIEHRWIQGGVYGALAALGGLMGLLQSRGPGQGPGPLARLGGSPLAIKVTAAVTLYALLLAGHSAAMLILDGRAVWSIWLLLAAVLAVGFFSDVNALGSHRMYRDRLMETFMPEPEAVRSGDWRPALEATGTLLEDAGTAPGPYHLFNTSMTTTGSSRPKYNARGADSFVLAPLYSGSEATGWRRTAGWPRHGLTVPTAMAVSAAAVNPGAGFAGQGPTRGWAVSTLLALLNLRLGYWTDNPDPRVGPRVGTRRPGLLVPGAFPLRFTRSFPFVRLRTPLRLTLLPHPLGHRESEDQTYVQLDDGGAFDSMGIYELIRREVDVVIVTDATGDDRFTFDALGDVIGRVWADFGVDVRFTAERSLTSLRPGSADAPAGPDGRVLSERAHSVADLLYPPRNGRPGKKGVLILVKAAMIPGLPLNVLTYKAAHPAFPDEPTLNQFFSERQFEAYRQLGFFTASQTLDDPVVREHMGDPVALPPDPAPAS